MNVFTKSLFLSCFVSSIFAAPVMEIQEDEQEMTRLNSRAVVAAEARPTTSVHDSPDKHYFDKWRLWGPMFLFGLVATGSDIAERVCEGAPSHHHHHNQLCTVTTAWVSCGAESLATIYGIGYACCNLHHFNRADENAGRVVIAFTLTILATIFDVFYTVNSTGNSPEYKTEGEHLGTNILYGIASVLGVVSIFNNLAMGIHVHRGRQQNRS